MIQELGAKAAGWTRGNGDNGQCDRLFTLCTGISHPVCEPLPKWQCGNGVTVSDFLIPGRPYTRQTSSVQWRGGGGVLGASSLALLGHCRKWDPVSVRYSWYCYCRLKGMIPGMGNDCCVGAVHKGSQACVMLGK